MAGVLALGVAGPAYADASSQTSANTGLTVDEAAELLLAAEATDGERLKAAELLVALSNWGRGDASEALLSALSVQRPVAVRRAALRSLSRVTGALPDEGVVDALLAWIDALPAELEADWASVLGRYEQTRVVDQLTALVHDPETAGDQKRLALRALGETRRVFAAKALVELVNDAAIDQATRNLTFDALASLSHLPALGRDAKAWSDWYGKTQRMNTGAWQRMLHQNLLRQTRDQAANDARLRDRLMQSQRALYRATAIAQRPALLISMLRDPIDNVRLLGMDLARQGLEDNNPFGDPLRSELRDRLSDPLPAIREQSATLLGQLLDDEAGVLMAQVLLEQGESDVKVQRAMLNALARLPRAEALTPAYQLLENAELRTAAAGMLAAGYREGKGNSAVWAEVRNRVRPLLDDVQSPEPRLITLLALVIPGNDAEGWSQIRGWLASEDELVREAAARSWVSAERDLLELANRSDDAVIRPIALKAISERGSGGATLRALAERRPTEPEDVRLWDQAMVALAGRVPSEVVLGTTQDLSQAKADTRQTREQMLTAALDGLAAQDPPAEPSRLRSLLLLARAQTRVLADAPALVVLDYEAALDQPQLLTETQADAVRRALVVAYLADRRIDDALDIVTLLLKPEGTLIAQAVQDPLVALLIQSIEDAIEQGRNEDALTVLAGLRTLLATAISAELDAKLLALREQAERDEPPPPPAEPAQPRAAS